MENKVFEFCKTIGNEINNPEKLKAAFWKMRTIININDLRLNISSTLTKTEDMLKNVKDYSR